MEVRGQPHTLAALPPKKVPTAQEDGSVHSQPGYFADHKNPLPLSELEPHIFQPKAWPLYWGTPKCKWKITVIVGECFSVLISAVEFQKIHQYYKQAHFWLPYTHGCSCSVLFATQYYAVVAELFKIFWLFLQNIKAVWYTISDTGLQCSDSVT